MSQSVRRAHDSRRRRRQRQGRLEPHPASGRGCQRLPAPGTHSMTAPAVCLRACGAAGVGRLAVVTRISVAGFHGGGAGVREHINNKIENSWLK
jgi:hypothetical protein